MIGEKILTVITVCYNAEKTISKSLESLLSQNTNDYNYLIIDGNSTDNTLTIIYKYISEFNKKGVKIKVISENDEGIYDAMNKGILNSDTEWIQFFNAGTYYYNNNTLKRVINKIKQCNKTDVLYGNCVTIDLHGRKKLFKTSAEDLLKTMTLSHESCFFRRQMHRKYMYNKKIFISADYNSLLKMYIDNRKFEHIDDIIIYYNEDGFSSVNRVETARQAQIVRYINGLIPHTKFNRFIIKSGLCVFKERVYYDILPFWFVCIWEHIKKSL